MSHLESTEQLLRASRLALGVGRAPRYTINTGGTPGTDVAAGAAVAAFARTVALFATAQFVVQFGEATTGSVGLTLAPNVTHYLHLPDPADATQYGDGKVHAQAPTASVTVYVTELAGIL